MILNGVPGPADRTMARETVDDGLRVLYVGRLSPRKGVDVAVSALGHLDEQGVTASLDLLGAPFPGYEWYQAELEDQVRGLGISDRVRFHGFKDVVWDVIHDADVVVVPSRVDEPFGNTAVEAVLCARPVVASATSGLLEATAGYGSAQTVPAGDARELAAALDRVATDWASKRVDAWADAGQAEARHAPEVYRRRVAAVVAEMLTGA